MLFRSQLCLWLEQEQKALAVQQEQAQKALGLMNAQELLLCQEEAHTRTQTMHNVMNRLNRLLEALAVFIRQRMELEKNLYGHHFQVLKQHTEKLRVLHLVFTQRIQALSV